MKFLIIEDDEDIFSLLKILLESLYHDAKTIFSNEKDSFNYVKKNSPDFIIMDINLPDFNGYDLGNTLRTLANKDIPILYISANKDYAFEGIEIGQKRVAFMGKPLKKEILAEKIQELLATRELSS